MKSDSKPPRRPSFGNTIPGGDVKELGDETAWAEWNKALEESDRQFSPTAPMTIPSPPEGGDPRYAKTQPASLPLTKDSAPRASARRARLTADEVMVEARKANRVCPRPAYWAELFGQFPKWAGYASELPSPPLSGDSWSRTPSIAKRMAFRAHIEWAEKVGCLEQLLGFVKELPEEGWHHMGD